MSLAFSQGVGFSSVLLGVVSGGGPPVVVVGFKESLVWSACAYGSVIFGFGVIPAQITQ